jgi:FkbM family methyltransferase
MGGFLFKVRKLLRLLPESQWRRGLLRGVAASVEHDRALAGLEFARIVDIGANRGQFSLFCRVRFPRAEIVAFEPQAAACRVFRTLFGDTPQVRLVEAAIAPSEGTAILHVSAQDDSSSLLPITARQPEYFPGTGEIATVEIRTGRLDTYLSPDDIRSPALLKIDVQGYEADVLRACESRLGLFDSVYVECSFVELYAGQALAPAINDWLRARGFRLKGRFNEATAPGIGIVQADFLFERADSGARAGCRRSR